jgi:hypothetical protein
MTLFYSVRIDSIFSSKTNGINYIVPITVQRSTMNAEDFWEISVVSRLVFWDILPEFSLSPISMRFFFLFL